MAVKPHLLTIVEESVTAAEAWDNLGILFEDKTTSRRDELEQELSALQMRANEPIIKYVGRAKGLRNELATAGVTLDEHSLVLHILRGLPAGYGMIRTVLKSSDTPLRLPATTAKLLGVEKELSSSQDGEIQTAVQAYLASMGIKKDGQKKTGEKPTCFYCKIPGHKIGECRKRLAADARKYGRRPGQDAGGDKKPDKGDKKLAFCARVERADVGGNGIRHQPGM